MPEDVREGAQEEARHRLSVVGLRLVEANGTQTGRAWDVTIMGPTAETPLVQVGGREFVQSRNRRLYSVEGLRASVGLFDGVKVYDNHLTPDEFAQRAGNRSFLTEGIGVLTSPRFDEGSTSLKARLSVVDRNAQAKFLEAYRAGVLQHIGLSVDTLPVPGQSVMREGAEWPVLEGFEKVISVDVVSNPAAGGAFDRLLEAQSDQEEETGMDPEEIKQLVTDTVALAVADALAAQSQASESEEDAPEEELVVEKAQPAEAPKADPKVEALEAEVARMKCERMLDKRLAEANLPSALEGAVRDQFAGKVFKQEALEQMVNRMKEAQSASDPSGRVTGAGVAGAVVTDNKRDGAEIAFMQWMMGSRFRQLEASEDQDVRERLPESYATWVKSGRRAQPVRRVSEWIYNLYQGDPFLDPRLMESQTTSDLTTIIKNTVNLMVAADYAVRERWWEALVSTEEVDTIDDVTLARLYGLDALDVVSEGAPYTEVNAADEEETASFVKKGNYIGITMEALARDKVQFIRSLPQRLASAWYNTLSDLVSGVFTVNSATGPVLGTTGALFNATAVGSAGGHANLGTSALTYSTWDAAVTAMGKQTDQPSGAGRRLMIRPRYLLVPVDLRATALQIRNSEQVPGVANNEINPYRESFEVVEVPNWTDTNNWAAMADPRQFPAIYLIFPRGQRVPQVFEAGNDTQGAMFTHDELRFKVRMMTYRFSSSYECAPVADFRPLYKANVS